MKLIAGKINGNWLNEILKDSEGQCDEIRAAVAYANGSPELIDFCFEKNIKFTFWGRYDFSIPVSTTILKRFLERRSPNQVCKLSQEYFHPKVIWWLDFGAYIGSANLTHSGWYRNAECGVFLTESELDETGLNIELEKFFDCIDLKSWPLTQEDFDHLGEFEKKYQEIQHDQKWLEEQFDQSRRIPRESSLVSVDTRNSDDYQRDAFLAEWRDTLQIMRDIGERVVRNDSRPQWIKAEVPNGVQADQFLHAYYYNCVRRNGKHPYREFYEEHKKDPEAALREALEWWKSLEAPPTREDRTIYDWAPFLEKHLKGNRLNNLSFEEFEQICRRIYAMRDHALRVDNATYGLSENESRKDQELCIHLLANYLWNQKSREGRSVVEVIDHVLWGGAVQDVPLRLWEATRSTRWRLPHLGISSLGEIVGWAMPNDFPPRNGRTSKALTALGYKVRVHSG